MAPIDPTRDRAYLDKLDRFWDGLVDGAPMSSLGLDRDATAAIRRLRQVASGVSPDPTFVARLRTELFESQPKPLPSPAVAAPLAPPVTGGRPDLRPRETWFERQRGRGRSRGWLITQLATAAILVLTIGAIYLAFGRGASTPAPSYVPMLGGGVARSGNVPGPAPVASPAVRWQFQTGNSVTSTAAVAAGVVYVGAADNQVYAIDAATGTERWRFQAVAGISSSPAVVDGTVYLGAGGPESSRGSVYALDAGTGQERWHVDAGPVRSSPAVVAGIVYVGSDDGNLYALDAATGAEQWRFGTGGPVASSPAVVDATVYVGSDDGNLYAVEIATGRERWRLTLDGPVTATPVVDRGRVFVASDAGTLYAVQATTGHMAWRVANGAGPLLNIAVANDIIFSAGGDGGNVLQAHATADGALRWKFTFGGVGTYGFASPIVADGTVYFASGSQRINSRGLLFAVDAKRGTERWHLSLGQTPAAAPAIIDGVLYVGTAEGRLIAVGEGDRPTRPPS
jgi:outer membrane protein assembly factor BamB